MFPRDARVIGGGVGAPVAFGHGTSVGEDDDGSTVVNGSRVGEVRLAEARGGREMHARRAERIWEGAVCGRRWVKVGAVLEAWAEGRPRHSKKQEGELDWGRWMDDWDVRCDWLYEVQWGGGSA